MVSQKLVEQFIVQQVTKLKHNSKVVVGAIEDFKDIFIQGYYKIKEFRYVLKADIKTVIESELVVDIETPLNIIFIIL